MSLFLITEVLQLYQKETPTQVFSCDYCEISKNTCFEEHPRTAPFLKTPCGCWNLWSTLNLEHSTIRGRPILNRSWIPLLKGPFCRRRIHEIYIRVFPACISYHVKQFNYQENHAPLLQSPYFVLPWKTKESLCWDWEGLQCKSKQARTCKYAVGSVCSRKKQRFCLFY